MSKSISFYPSDNNPAQREQSLDESEGFLEGLRDKADKWFNSLGVMPNYKLNSIILYAKAENKAIKDISLDISHKEKHVQFKIFAKLFTLLSNRKKKKIVESVRSIMFDLTRDWTFNVIFERYKK